MPLPHQCFIYLAKYMKPLLLHIYMKHKAWERGHPLLCFLPSPPLLCQCSPLSSCSNPLSTSFPLTSHLSPAPSLEILSHPSFLPIPLVTRSCTKVLCACTDNVFILGGFNPLKVFLKAWRFSAKLGGWRFPKFGEKIYFLSVWAGSTDIDFHRLSHI